MSPATPPETSPGVVVVGVIPGQPELVLRRAAEFAADLGARLVCASVDASRYSVQENIDGSVTSLPFDPDLPELGEVEFDPGLADHIRQTLAGSPVPWSLRALAGDPARALARLAETLDARLIVVGTREAGVRAGLHKFFTGSVGIHLAHRQHRPVLIVPLAPVGHTGQLPWEAE
ncbi:MAG: universal stress protein [Microbacteriaceae bacterium]